MRSVCAGGSPRAGLRSAASERTRPYVNVLSSATQQTSIPNKPAEADYCEWCKVHGIKARWGAVGSHKSIAIIERFWRTLKDECCRRIVVPLGLAEMQSELDVYTAWYNQHRPHRALTGVTPAERRAESVAAVVQLETRARVPIHGDPELTRRVSSLELSVDGYEGRGHLPVVTLRAA